MSREKRPFMDKRERELNRDWDEPRDASIILVGATAMLIFASVVGGVRSLIERAEEPEPAVRKVDPIVVAELIEDFEAGRGNVIPMDGYVRGQVVDTVRRESDGQPAALVEHCAKQGAGIKLTDQIHDDSLWIGPDCDLVIAEVSEAVLDSLDPGVLISRGRPDFPSVEH